MGWKKTLTLQSRRGYERSKAAARAKREAELAAQDSGDADQARIGSLNSHGSISRSRSDDNQPKSQRWGEGRREGGSARGIRRGISESNLGRKISTVFRSIGSKSVRSIDTARESVFVSTEHPPAQSQSQPSPTDSQIDQPAKDDAALSVKAIFVPDEGGGGGNSSKSDGEEDYESSNKHVDSQHGSQSDRTEDLDHDAVMVSDAYFKKMRGSPSLSCSMLNASNHSPRVPPRGQLPGRRNSSSSLGGSSSGIERGLRRELSSRRESFANKESIITGELHAMSAGDFEAFVRNETIKAWLMDFKDMDPRNKILNFFNDVAQEGGAENVDFDPSKISPILRAFYKASVFSVWRPTSKDAIRRMMMGEGVGKGLDIKGKSAKRGKLSAFVPFLQIYKEEHKKMVRTLRRDGKVRVYFDTRQARDHVMSNLQAVAAEMIEAVKESKRITLEQESSNYDEETINRALENLKWDMEDSSIGVIDSYAPQKYGLDVPERLFWEGMVVRQSIHREEGSPDDIGRPSLPSFQDMNFGALRKTPEMEGQPRAVITMYTPPGEDGGDPMSPLNLVMAYEESDPAKGISRVIPVVSDFDCFMVGTRGVKYEEKLPEDQLQILKWCVAQVETILKEKNFMSWTERWLEVLKTEASKGFHPEIPPLGFSDPKTNYIFKHAIQRLSHEGAVRHGAECFNFYFPQDLDEEFLFISDDLPDQTLRWKYVNQVELQNLLKGMIEKGYTFPLNPKWVLCDHGWKDVYDQLMKSHAPNVQDSLTCWYPPESGLRELIEHVHGRYREGFQRLSDADVVSEVVDELKEAADGTAAMDLAEEKLKHYLTLQRAKSKLVSILTIKRNLDRMREKNLMKEILARAPKAGES